MLKKYIILILLFFSIFFNLESNIFANEVLVTKEKKSNQEEKSDQGEKPNQDQQSENKPKDDKIKKQENESEIKPTENKNEEVTAKESAEKTELMPNEDILAILDVITVNIDKMSNSPTLKNFSHKPSISFLPIINHSHYHDGFLDKLNLIVEEYALINQDLDIMRTDMVNYTKLPDFVVEIEIIPKSDNGKYYFIPYKLYDNKFNLKGYWSDKVFPKKNRKK